MSPKRPTRLVVKRKLTDYLLPPTTRSSSSSASQTQIPSSIANKSTSKIITTSAATTIAPTQTTNPDDIMPRKRRSQKSNNFDEGGSYPNPNPNEAFNSTNGTTHTGRPPKVKDEVETPSKDLQDLHLIQDSKLPSKPPITPTSTSDPKRYHQPHLPPAQDPVVMRQYYPAEMSDYRANGYKLGKIPLPMNILELALSQTQLARGAVPLKDAVVHWFRTDLRVRDNMALYAASLKARGKGSGGGGRNLIGLYIISPEEFEAHIRSPARVDFILRSLKVLQRDLAELDIPLWVETLPHRKDIHEFLNRLLREWNASHLFANIEYEVDELRRDAKLVPSLLREGVDFTLKHDNLIVPPEILRTKGSGQPFTVFTPYYKAWLDYLGRNPRFLELSPKPEPNTKGAREVCSHLFECPIPESVFGKELQNHQANLVRNTFPAGEEAAVDRVEWFVEKRIKNYKEARDLPTGQTTSMLSVHFAAGTLSARSAILRARQWDNMRELHNGDRGVMCWISEIVWREFYRYILIHNPWVCMSKPFKIQYSNLEWKYDEKHFEAWCNGRTGYPIVDAAMRQLVTEKWMHNRCRMIVASFLTKDLCIDWRRGEKFFMEHLIDGDLASNNGGWGWSSSTGCDAQPYFRIFNPLLQSEKFDPEGEYIREWIPELRDVQGKAVHAPSSRLKPSEWGKVAKLGYPKPIVDHASAKEDALKMYNAVKPPGEAASSSGSGGKGGKK